MIGTNCNPSAGREMRDAKPHPLNPAPEDVFSLARKALNQTIDSGD